MDQRWEALCADVVRVGQRIRAQAGGGVEVRRKDDGTPVSHIDEEAEAALLVAIGRHLPKVAVIGEESGVHGAEAGTFFLVDALDGTEAFLKGSDEYTVNVALIEDGAPVAGIVYAPALERLFCAWNGAAWEGKKQLRMKAPAEGATALISYRADAQTEKWLRTKCGVVKMRKRSSSLKFGLLAAGEGHVYARFSPTMTWDTAAGDAIVRAAGGEMRRLTQEGEDAGAFDYAFGVRVNPPFMARCAPVSSHHATNSEPSSTNIQTVP